MQIARSGGVHPRQPATAQMKHGAALGPCRHAQRKVPRHARHVDFGAEDQLRVRDQRLTEQILAVTLEPFIVVHLEYHEHVATRPAARSDVAHPAERHVLASGHTGRHRDLERAIGAHPPLATTLLARVGHHHPLAGARGAWRDRDELAEERALRPPHLTGSTTGAARRRLGSRLGAGPLTLVAGLEHLERDGLLDTGGHFGQREWQRQLDVGAAARPGTPATSRGAEQVTESTEVAHEDVERVGQVHVFVGGLCSAAAQSGLPVSIERRALLRITQHVVRFGDRLELLLGLLRTTVAVGVPLHRQPAISLLDIVVGCVARYAKNRVEVSHGVVEPMPRKSRENPDGLATGRPIGTRCRMVKRCCRDPARHARLATATR